MKDRIYGVKDPNHTYRKRPGAYGIAFNTDRQVALVKVDNTYFLPGGGIEEGEDPVTCLRREFVEETGCQVEVGAYLDRCTQFTYSKTRQRHYQLVGSFYLVHIQQMTNGKVEDDHELVWADLSEVNDLIRLEYHAVMIHEAYAMAYAGS